MRGAGLSMLFFGFLVVVPIIDTACLLFGVDMPGRRFSSAPLSLSLEDVRFSTAGKKIENFYAGRSIIYHGTGAIYNELMFRIVGRTNGVVAAEGGWLFLKSHSLELEEKYVDSQLESGIEFVSAISSSFEESGSKLLVVAIPDRPRLYPEIAYGSRVPSRRGKFLPDIVSGFQERGVWCLDLTKSLKELIAQGVDSHFKVDHHWSYEGSRAAANAVAEEIESSGDLGDVVGARAFEVSWEEMSPPPNRSLVSFLKFRKESQAERQFLHTQRVAEFDLGWKEMAPDGKDRSVLVLESSFGMFGFSQDLETTLGVGVDSIVEPGNGSVFAPALCLSGGGLNISDYPIVVWAIPEYHLLAGLEVEAKGMMIRLPDPVREVEIDQFVEPVRESGKGVVMDDALVEIRAETSFLEFEFGEPVDAVRLAFRCDGGVKRGLMVYPDDEDSGLLIFSGTGKRIEYDLRFDEPSSEARVKLLFSSLGYRLEDWSVRGIKFSASN